MYKRQGEGVCRNFENAILNCSGDVIFLCDQDDVWLPNKVERVMKAIENGADVVLHDAMMTDGELNVTDESFFSLNGSKRGFVRNFLKNSYICLLYTSLYYFSEVQSLWQLKSDFAAWAQRRTPSTE